MKRLLFLLKAKMSRMLDKAENPLETLDYSYELQLGELQKVNRGLTDVVTAKKRLEIQSKNLESQIEKLSGQARAAVQADRDDLARVALERKAGLEAQKQQMDRQVEDLEAKQAQLQQAQEVFKQRIESFRFEKESLKARYRAGEAMVAIGEATTGLGQATTNAGLAIERAKEKTEQMQARASAIAELVDSGAIDDKLSGESKLDRELRELASSSQVDNELSRLKAELGPATPHQALGQAEDPASPAQEL